MKYKVNPFGAKTAKMSGGCLSGYPNATVLAGGKIIEGIQEQHFYKQQSAPSCAQSPIGQFINMGNGLYVDRGVVTPLTRSTSVEGNSSFGGSSLGGDKGLGAGLWIVPAGAFTIAIIAGALIAKKQGNNPLIGAGIGAGIILGIGAMIVISKTVKNKKMEAEQMQTPKKEKK